MHKSKQGHEGGAMVESVKLMYECVGLEARGWFSIVRTFNDSEHIWICIIQFFGINFKIRLSSEPRTSSKMEQPPP